MTTQIKTLIFVCTGNICRSPMAEYLFSSMMSADSGWHACSAGVSAINGMPASLEAVQVMAEKGIDIRVHQSRMLTRNMVDSAAMILVMTSTHMAVVNQRFTNASGRVFLLNSFGVNNESGDIADPIGDSVDVYRRTRDEIENALLDFALFLDKEVVE